MKIKVCDKCRGTNIKTLLPKLKSIGNNTDIEVGCINYCGVGRNKIVVIVDHLPIIGTNEDEIIAKIMEYQKKQ